MHALNENALIGVDLRDGAGDAVERSDGYRYIGTCIGRPIRILIVYGHPVFGDGLNAIIAPQSDMTVVAQVPSSLQAVEEFRHHMPDVTVMDQSLPLGAGDDTLAVIRGGFPHARIIVLSTSDGDSTLQRVLRAGASAIVPRTTSRSELVKIIRLVHSGRKHIPAEVAARFAEHFADDNLTPREIDVLKLMGEGNRNKQIAGLLSIAETTVNFHIKNLVDKLRANDRTHAVAIAIRRGLLSL